MAGLSLLFVLLSCTNDPYDTGDGPLSYMVAGLAEANTDASSNIVSITTDDGDLLPLSKTVKASWAEKADTAYRALVYYNYKAATGEDGAAAELLSMSQVLTPQVYDVGDLKEEVLTDPVVFNSAWKSNSNKFINFDLSLKTGTSDSDDAGQTIGVVCDAVEQRADGTRLVKLRLYHDQGSVPEYYSAQVYLSIPVEYLPIEPSAGDGVEIDINTYDGHVVKNFFF